MTVVHAAPWEMIIIASVHREAGGSALRQVLDVVSKKKPKLGAVADGCVQPRLRVRLGSVCSHRSGSDRRGACESLSRSPATPPAERQTDAAAEEHSILTAARMAASSFMAPPGVLPFDSVLPGDGRPEHRPGHLNDGGATMAISSTSGPFVAMTMNVLNGGSSSEVS